MLAFLAVGALLLGAAAPAPAPTPANPFNFDPAPVETALPLIGTTRAKPACTAIRRAIAPAVAAALKSDQAYSGIRKRIFDYVLTDSDEARDVHLLQMDREVDKMVKELDALVSALQSPALDVTPTTGPEDAKTLRELRASMAGVLAAQKVQLDTMNAFVETERMRRFGRFNETELNMQRAMAPSVAGPNGGPAPALPPVGAFLRTSNQTLKGAIIPVHGAHLIDRDLREISAFTTAHEDAASKIIIPVANSCK